MSEAAIPFRAVCGRCLYFKRTGTVVARGGCRYYSRAVHASMDCLATGKPETELPHCQTCDKPIQPALTARSGSKYCVECWEVERQRREEERKNQHLMLGLQLGASANGGKPVRLVAWCSWGLIQIQPPKQASGGALVGGILGGALGAMIGAALDPSSGGDAPITYKATIGLLAVTDTELLAVDLGQCELGLTPDLTSDHVQARSRDQEALARARVMVSRFPLSVIRPWSDGASIKFEFERKARQFVVASDPEIPHQPNPESIVRAVREAQAAFR